MKKILKRLRYKLFLLIFDRNKKIDFNPKSNKKILFSHLHNYLGDTIISTYIYPILKQNGYEIHTLTREINSCILQHNDSIDKQFIAKKGIFQRIKILFKLRAQNYDLIVVMNDHSFIRKHIALYSLIKSKNIFSFNCDHIKLVNININYKDTLHITNRYKILLEFLQIKPLKPSYHLKTSLKIKQEVEKFLKNSNYQNFVALNPFGSVEDKKFSKKQIEDIVEFLNSKGQKVLIVGKPKEIKTLNLKNVLYNSFDDFLYSIEILKNAKFLISPDTSLVHASCALNIPVIACYRNPSSLNLWKPIGQNILTLNTNEKKGFVKDIETNKILFEIDKFLKLFCR